MAFVETVEFEIILLCLNLRSKDEEWKFLHFMEMPFIVSSFGRVFDIHKREITMGKLNIHGSNCHYNVRIDLLVLMTFKPIKKYHYGRILHLDNNKLNNRSDNLTWKGK